MIGTKILFKVVRIIHMNMLIVNYGNYAGTNDNILVLFKLSGFFAFAQSLFFLKASHLVAMKCNVVGRSCSLKCARVFIDFGQRKKRKSSSSFNEEEPCSSLTIAFLWPVLQSSDQWQ